MAALYQVSPCNDWFPPKMVFSSLAKLRERTASTPQTDAIPDGRRIYAIGDIHGRRDLFDELIDRIMADGRRLRSRSSCSAIWSIAGRIRAA